MLVSLYMLLLYNFYDFYLILILSRTSPLVPFNLIHYIDKSARQKFCQQMLHIRQRFAAPKVNHMPWCGRNEWSQIRDPIRDPRGTPLQTERKNAGTELSLFWILNFLEWHQGWNSNYFTEMWSITVQWIDQLIWQHTREDYLWHSLLWRSVESSAQCTFKMSGFEYGEDRIELSFCWWISLIWNWSH